MDERGIRTTKAGAAVLDGLLTRLLPSLEEWHASMRGGIEKGEECRPQCFSKSELAMCIPCIYLLLVLAVCKYD